MSKPERSPPPPPPNADDYRPMSDLERIQINALLEAQLGLSFPEHKHEILEARLLPRLRAHGLRTFTEYLRLLGQSEPGELAHLRRAVTNHETYFFRETHQFEALFNHGLDDLCPEVGERRMVRVLSAGCATGEEPYTLGFYVKENQFRTFGRQITIEAFDLCDICVAAAERAEYGHSSLRAMTDEQVSRYLSQIGPDRYRIKPAWRTGVQFRTGNAMQLSTFYRGEPFDVVFCRNMLIYFAEPALRHAVENFAAALRPGGLLFLGHSESIIGMTDAFEVVRIGHTIAYKRVAS